MRKRIIIAGLPRSGSTALFNIIRLICEKCGSVYSGEINDDDHPSKLPSDVDYQVLKTHKFNDKRSPFWVDANTIVFTSYRDPDETIASMRRFRQMGNTGVGAQPENLVKFLIWWGHWNVYIKNPLAKVDYWKLDRNPEGVILDILPLLDLPKQINERRIYLELCALRTPKTGKDEKTLLHFGHITSESVRERYKLALIEAKEKEEKNKQNGKEEIRRDNDKTESDPQAESEEGSPGETYYD